MAEGINVEGTCISFLNVYITKKPSRACLFHIDYGPCKFFLLGLKHNTEFPYGIRENIGEMP